jgi:ATP-dependent DNA helicase RecG
MTRDDIKSLLDEFRSLPAETEWVEFKEAKTKFDFDDLGKYFSALSNEANLKGKDFGWLIFGVRDSDRSIVGTEFRRDRASLDSVKGEISTHTNSRIGFVEVHEFLASEGRVLLFQIPKAVRGIPTEWRGHCYGRDGDSTVALSAEKRERIRNQHLITDWSSGFCPDAKLDDLDTSAILQARINYKLKFPDRAVDVDSWNDATFLNKARITIKGQITRTAIILLGKEESDHFVSPADVKIRWVLKDSKGTEIDWAIESCPFIFAVDRIYSRIRNVRYRYMRSETLFPEEVDRYEPFIIREAINNCIAHQDYELGGRINVVEGEDFLVFTNLGTFLPGSIERVIEDNAPEERYRNTFLANAMANLKMVDTIGSGVRTMFNYQRARFFPLPEYDLSNNRVKVTVIGKVLDMEFATVLARDPNLELSEIMLLDKVQKKLPITTTEAARLRKKKLIEGIKPNYFISAEVAQSTKQKASYTRAKAFEKQKYFGYIFRFLEQHGEASRGDIDSLLWDLLPGWMTERQKKTKINHLLTELSASKGIRNLGSKHRSRWVLSSENG